MATSQFFAVCLARKSITACRALWLASPSPMPRSFLRTKAMTIAQISFQGGSTGYGCNRRGGPSAFACRALSSVGPACKSRKPTPQNPREEIRKLDDEIRRLEKERRSVGKTRNTGVPIAGGKSSRGGSKGNAGYSSDAVSKAKYAKPSAISRNAKFTASAGSSRSANARALARYAQEEAEEEDDVDDEEENDIAEDDDDDDDKDDDAIADEDDEELGEDFSSDAEMYMEISDEEQLPKVEASSSQSSISQKIISDCAESHEIDEIQSRDPVVEASMGKDANNEGVHSIKHPWKEWNDFYEVLEQKNYFKDVPPSKYAMEGEGYLRFQSSSHMKHAILEFGRERDDIIRFLTKKHIKVVVTVGCPSTDRKVVNACKRLRVICEVPEDEVCQQCKLKSFCTRAFAAPSPDLMAETVDVVRVLYTFALNASPIAESQVSYPMSVVKSACHLLNEIVQLSAYPKDPGLPALKSRLPVKQPPRENRDVESNHRPGDWTCPDCNFVNFAKNRECRECGTFRDSRKSMDPGDWECPECTFVNFRRNRECRECQTARPASASGSGNLMPGDWKCPECQFVNYRRNSECHKCSTRRPKGISSFEDEELEPGDWKCPECNFRNFKRNKNCKECGTLSPDHSKRDDRWGLRKSSGGGWGLSKTLQSQSTDSGASSGRLKYQEWKPDLSAKVPDDSEDEDLEENADIVFGLSGGEDDDNDLSRSSRALKRRTKLKGGFSQRKDSDELSLSDFGFSDLDDLPKDSSKKSAGHGKSTKHGDDDKDGDEDDDNEMEDELSEDEKKKFKAASKQGRGFLGQLDDSDSDNEEDSLPTSRGALKHASARRSSSISRWDDSDDEEDGYLDDNEIGGPKRGSAFARGRGGGGKYDGRRGGLQRGGRFGSSRGVHRGESYGSSRGRGGGAFARKSSKFSESDDDGDFRSHSRHVGGGGSFRGNGRGRGRDGSSWGRGGRKRGGKGRS